MRRLLSATVLAAVVALGAAACSDTTGTEGTATTGAPAPTSAAGATGSTAAPGTGLPADAARACSEAKQTIGETISVLGQELAKAGTSDAAVQQAITTAREKFAAGGTKLTELANREVPAEVKTAISQAATTFNELASPNYTGSAQDVQQKLLGLGTSLQQLC